MSGETLSRRKYAVTKDVTAKTLVIEDVESNLKHASYSLQDISERLLLKTKLNHLELYNRSSLAQISLNKVLLNLINHYFKFGVEILMLQGFKLPEDFETSIFKTKRNATLSKLVLFNVSNNLLTEFCKIFASINILKFFRKFKNFKVISKLILFNKITKLDLFNHPLREDINSFSKNNVFFKTISKAKTLKYISVNLRSDELLFPRVKLSAEGELGRRTQTRLRDIFMKYGKGKKRQGLYFLDLPNAELLIKFVWNYGLMDVFSLRRVMTIIERASLRGQRLEHAASRKIIEGFKTPRSLFKIFNPITRTTYFEYNKWALNFPGTIN